ncbi:MAG: MobF family relaxase [Gemmatimonadales bacterium]
MVGITKIQRGNAGYWINAVAEGSEDYYTKPGEAPAEWIGELAGELGLEGKVDRDSYAAALAGRHPETGEELVRRPKPRTFTDSVGRERHVEPVLGYDVRFAAPKSVSLLYAVGSSEVRDAVVAAHDAAVREAFSYLENEACFVQRGPGGKEIQPGAGLIGMAFRHRMSRAGDPALHTHVVVPNTTQALSDDRWLSLASPQGRSAFWQHAKAAGYVYQAALRAEVTRELGLEWGEVRNGHADLAVIERPVIEHFSQRRMEIEAAMAERGVSSAAAAEVAAYRTREAKDYGVDVDERRSEWIARAAEFDLGATSVDAMLERAHPHEPKRPGRVQGEAALAALEESRSHFDRREVICALAAEMGEGTGAAALAERADLLLESDHVIRVHEGADSLAPTYFTTPRTWRREQRFVAIAERGKEAGAAVVDRASVEAVIERHRYLGDDQREMVARLLGGGERIVPVAALPGTGKTTALAAAREAWEAAGHDVIGVATARSAAGELADAGIPSMSIAKLLISAEELRSEGVQPLRDGTVVFVDESSTTSTADSLALAELVAECEGKLVEIGDPRQIGAIGPGGLYGHLTQVVEPSVLTEIRRQRAEVDREIVRLAHAGRGSDALDLLRAEGRLVIADTHDEALRAVALDWHTGFAAGDDAVMIARRNRDVAELNRLGRALLAAEGRLGGAEVEVGGERFAVGDRVITRVNTAHVSNRERWEVSAVDARRNEIELRRIGGEERGVVLRSRYLDFTTPSGEPSLQHAYAISAYAAESKTFERAFALLDAGATREEFLVSVSRSRGPTTAYGVAALVLTDAELGPGTRSIEDAAHELRVAAERPGDELPALEVSERQRVAAMNELGLAERLRALEERRLEAARPSPARGRLESLERSIAGVEERLEVLRGEYAELVAERRPSAERVELVSAAGRDVGERLARLRAERTDVVEQASAEDRPRPLSRAERVELGLIEERMAQLRRRDIGFERLDPSPLIREALGERPSDPVRAAAWNEGVDAIYSYRQRHNVRSHEHGPLGPEPREGPRRDAWRQTQRRLEQVRGVLERGRAQDRSTELDVGIEI